MPVKMYRKVPHEGIAITIYMNIYKGYIVYIL